MIKIAVLTFKNYSDLNINFFFIDIMDNYLRYLSTLALVTSLDKRKIIMGYRKDDDRFFPGMPAFPGGRVSGNEILEDRVAIECNEEAGVAIAKINMIYLGNCVFPRDDYFVTQLAFAVPAKNDEFLRETKELKGINYFYPHELRQLIPKEGYFLNYHAFIDKAIELGTIEIR